MKKVWLIIGGVFIALVAALVLVLILLNPKDTPKQPLELKGSWLIYQHGELKTVGEVMAFDGEKVTLYKNGEKYASSAYTFADDRLTMTDIAKEFAVAVKTDNVVVLIEPDTVEWKIARISDSAESITPLTTDNLQGTYDVIAVAAEKRSGETMTFTSSVMTDERDGQTFLASDFTLESDAHLLHAVTVKKDYYVYSNGSHLIMIDAADLYVWELEKR